MILKESLTITFEQNMEKAAELSILSEDGYVGC